MVSKIDQEVTTNVVTGSDIASDDAIINKFGYEQAYRRVFKTVGNIAIALSFTSPMMGFLIISVYQLTYGGYWGLTWGWMIPAILFLPQSFAIAELCSSMPTNGALYWWSAALSPPRYSRPISFISGWIIFMSNMSILATFGYAVTTFYTTLVSILHPDWAATNAEKMGISMAFIVIWAVMNALQMEKLSILFQAIASCIICAAFVYVIGIPSAHAAQHRPFTSGHVAFTQYMNSSEWNNAVAVPMTFFSAAFVIAGWQCPAYIAEETQNARIAAPKAIVVSYSVTAVIGFFVSLVSALCVEDMAATVADPSGIPLFAMVLSNFGNAGGTTLLIIIVTCTALGGGSILFTISSQLAAFARDGGLPFSRTFAYVHPRTNMPFAAMILLCTSSFLILIFSLSPVAGSIIYSLAVIGIYMTMGLPIALRLFAGKRFVQGPFNFGRYSWPIHAWALFTMVYIAIMECFPLSPTWTKATFNYNWCVALGATIAATCLWFAYGRKHYKGVDLGALTEFQAEVQHELRVERDLADDVESKA